MPLNVLIIEDNAADVMLLEEALGREAACDCTVIDHGDRALEYLQSLIASHGGTIPDLILLDLNLPGRDGVEVLNAIRGMPQLMHVPVAVISSSPKDILARKAAHADCYLTKPSSLEDFLALGKVLLRCAGGAAGGPQPK